MTLTARVDVLATAGEDALDVLRAGLPFVRGLGSQRRRGLGRARIELIEDATLAEVV
jgi:hypothetical protein